MADKPFLPELLAPAGNEESLRAALAGGADAVYFGGAMFSNRMRAKNFAGDSIRDAIKLCHSVGAAAHITVNTRVRDNETDELLSFVDTVLGGKTDERADALIIADLGVARLIKNAYPDAVLHASTQTSMMSPADCRALSELGFSRLVVPRELSLDEIRSLAASSTIEIEMFLHGAHCVSCSGQCLMSFVMGGRSGNRGECAQPCRLPYRMESDCRQIGGNYPLSMADMYLGGHIPEIISSGVASLKIEGRLKSSNYVYGVTKIYRRLLDERRKATAAEKQALEDLFTRGFTDGYFVSDYSGMGGVKSSEKTVNPASVAREISLSFSERASAFRTKKSNEKSPSIPLTARFTLLSGCPARFELYCGSESGVGVGQVPVSSTGNPVTAESAAKNLTKLGSSGFSLDVHDIEFTIDDGLWMPLSALNEIRRQALEDLSSKVRILPDEPSPKNIKTFAPHCISAKKTAVKRDAHLTAEVADLSLFTRSGGDLSDFAARFSRVYVPLNDFSSASGYADNICATLPVFSLSDGVLTDKLTSAAEKGLSRVLCHTIGQVSLVRSLGMSADASFRANVTNSYAASVYADLGVASLAVSPELGTAAAREIALSTGCDIGLIGYGRLPLMLLSRCVISGGSCKKGNAGGRSRANTRPHTCTGELCDRIGEHFSVIGQSDCTNVVYNSVPVWMGDRMKELTLGGHAGFIHFIFTTETITEANDVLSAYLRGEKRPGRRI